ncbi:TPA: DUF551 domain-containing protein [Klebsiella michiganensis]
MTKSTITRERLEKIKTWCETYGAGSNVMLPAEEAEELASIALAAMDNEPVAWTWHYREQWHVTNDKCRAEFVAKDGDVAVLPLYRHAQPAPVVDADDNFYSWFGREWAENYQYNQYTTAAKQMLGVMAESAWIAATERQRQKQSVSVPDVKIYEDVPYGVGRFKTHRDCYCDGWNACRAAMLNHPSSIQPNTDAATGTEIKHPSSNSPAIPEGYVMVPKEPTAQMYDAGDRQMTTKQVWDAMLAAAPHDTPTLNSLQSVDSVADRWIPVSERMPDVGVKVLCFPVKDEPIHATFNGQLWLQDVSWSGSDDPIDNVIPVSVTHWMPLPAAPQEVK